VDPDSARSVDGRGATLLQPSIRQLRPWSLWHWHIRPVSPFVGQGTAASGSVSSDARRRSC